jgi:DNA polymerase (family 10)
MAAMAPANEAIAAVFDTMARVLAFENKDHFRALAYERAARSLRGLKEDVSSVAAEGRLREIPGVGRDLSSMIEEYLKTGHVERCERERRGLPDSLVALMEIPSLGPKTLALLHQKFHVETADDLERALAGDEIRSLRGFGERRVASLRRGVALWRAGRQRMPLGEALPRAEALLLAIRRVPGVERADVAGSVRRGRDTIGDFDVLIVARDGRAALAGITQLDGVRQVVALGPTRATFLVEPGIQVDVRAVAEESYGSALVYFTGAKEHNVRLRGLAHDRGLKINEYGVYRGARRLGGSEEGDVYRILGMDVVPPELREDRGEIEAALEGRLPMLLERSDLRGEFHVHSTYSDGTATVAEIADAAERLGYEYVAIADHSPSSRIARGLGPQALSRKLDELERVRAERGGRRPHLLFATEVDIRADGTLDYPADVLARFDVVIAAIHGSFRQGRDRMTKRILAAVANPFVHVLGHPTARLLGAREPVDFDFDRVAKACAESGVALEVNGAATRLDLVDTDARRARAAGALLAIASDAHSVVGLEQIRLAVCQARRGWVDADGVVNARSWARLLRWLGRRNDRCVQV